VSSFESDFNADFNVWLTEDQQRTGDYEHNYERGSALQMNGDDGPVAEIAAMTGTDVATYTRDRPGMSAFIVEDGAVYHSYSTYARGVDGLWDMYQWLDRPRDVTNPVSGGGATTRTRRAESRPEQLSIDRRSTCPTKSYRVRNG
jgi:predicted dithiol-disulfide oxidoreductase (DUF899 family)